MIDINNIYNVDAYKKIKEMQDNSVDCIYTDVPYLYQTGGIGKSELGQRMGKVRGELSEISKGFDYSILDEFVRIMKKINIFIWCSKAQMLYIMNYFENMNVNFEILTWNKTNPVPRNNSWNSDIEYCLTFREKNHTLNSGYHLKSKWYISPLNKKDKDLYNRPTIKPLELVKRHLLHTTKEGDIVFDPFAGSGTTMVASKQINRRYLGFEIDEKYFEIATDRLKNITQLERNKEKSGQASIFDIMEES